MIASPPEEVTVLTSAGKSSMGKDPESLFPAVCTLVLWVSCLVIGGVGIALPYQRPQTPEKPAPPIQAEILNVELTSDPLPPEPVPQQPSTMAEPPSLIELPAPSQAPQMIAVAEPSPAVAFALPVEGPTRVVEVAQASYARSSAPAEKVTSASPAPPVQALTYGQGEGKQPAPDYPRRATREGQEGTVVVRFTVGENGRVLAAQASSPCPWPLLNESAVNTVRERWRFAPGPLRVYQVAIRFQLTK